MKIRYLATALLLVSLSFTGCENKDVKTEVKKVYRPVKYITVHSNSNDLFHRFSARLHAQLAHHHLR